MSSHDVNDAPGRSAPQTARSAAPSIGALSARSLALSVAPSVAPPSGALAIRSVGLSAAPPSGALPVRSVGLSAAPPSGALPVRSVAPSAAPSRRPLNAGARTAGPVAPLAIGARRPTLSAQHLERIMRYVGNTNHFRDLVKLSAGARAHAIGILAQILIDVSILTRQPGGRWQWDNANLSTTDIGTLIGHRNGRVTTERATNAFYRVMRAVHWYIPGPSSHTARRLQKYASGYMRAQDLELLYGQRSYTQTIYMWLIHSAWTKHIERWRAAIAEYTESNRLRTIIMKAVIETGLSTAGVLSVRLRAAERQLRESTPASGGGDVSDSD